MKKRSTAYRLNKVDYLIFIFCSLAAAFMLFLFYRDLTSFTIKQAESPVAKIYYKKNTVQRKYLDNEIWEVLNDSGDIYDGDRIRTSKNSEAYTEFSDSGIQIQIHENSMVQIFKTKSQHSINFIGGEIFVANNSPEEKLVIHSGKKEISVSQSSEVKLALPEVSKAVAAGAEEAVEEDNTVVIEVVSGQVEVSEHAKKPETGSQISEPMVVSAGEKITLLPTVGEFSKEKTDIVAGIAESAAVEEPVAEDVEISEIEEPAVVKTETPAVTQTVIPTQAEPVVIPPEPITVGVEKKYERGIVNFQRNDYDRANGKYNYGTGCNLFEVTENNKTIPAGTALEFTMRGTSNKDISRWAIQISTGEEEWVQAHPFKNSFGNDGKGITANVSFTYKTVYVLNKPIVNTNSSCVNICYDP